MTTTYMVHFEVIAPKFSREPRLKAVTISEGYSTFEDIRKILALPLGLKSENINVLALALR